MGDVRVIGIRHGEVHNPGHVIYAGLSGYGLSAAGRDQARAAADGLRGVEVEALYASPLERALETAAPIAEATGVDVVADERLYEWRHWAQWAGMTWEQLATDAADAWQAYRDAPASVTSGESLAELAARVRSWLDDVRAAHTGLVVAVSHLEPLRAICLSEAGRGLDELFSFEVGLGQAVVVHPDPDCVPAPVSRLI